MPKVRYSFVLMMFVVSLTVGECVRPEAREARAAVHDRRGVFDVQKRDTGQEEVSKIVVGRSTWKDVEQTFGKFYLVEESSDPHIGNSWFMVYPMRQEYGRDLFFRINRETGVVEGRFYGLREPELVKRLVTEFHAPYCDDQEAWGTPQYKGIIVGKSTRADIQDILGSPDKVEECGAEERKFAVLEYSSPAEFEGKVVVGVHCERGIVDYIHLRPRPPWPLEKALEMYGPGYCYRRFVIREDPESVEYGIPEEDPRGYVVGIEYRSLGVVLEPDSQDRIRLIMYSYPKD